VFSGGTGELLSRQSLLCFLPSILHAHRETNPTKDSFLIRQHNHTPTEGEYLPDRQCWKRLLEPIFLDEWDDLVQHDAFVDPIPTGNVVDVL